ncbi:SpaA isopeptide-forming pilin-related protein [Erysipelothrix urinaevulpis]|uniref:SpaA isopeptide-forming pilin-related protein n=1 Tax=Erysipelothrix urinaevulpis TaxID=2683717 RepID=UPI001356C6EC|nr:SpaA isopeptide-forming pilin-related protein [Erysipelothrix urinaevulpis]
MKKRIVRVLSTSILTMVMLISSIGVSANTHQDNIKMTNENIVKNIINKKETKVSLEKSSEIQELEVSLDFKVNEKRWEEVKELDSKIEIKFPEHLRINKNEKIKFENTDENFSKDTLHNLNDDLLQFKNNGFQIDLSGLSEKPHDFRIKLEFVIDGDIDKIIKEDLEVYPVMESINPYLVDIAKKAEKEDQKENVDKIDVEGSTSMNSNNNMDIESVESTKIPVSGVVELKLKGQPDASLKYKNKLVSDSYPIDMKSYDESSNDYQISLYSENSSSLDVEYVIKLDQKSLDKIDDTAINDIFDFGIFDNGEKVPFVYDYKFPEMIRFHYATGNSILASSKFEDYSLSSFERVNPEGNDGLFKLKIEETILDTGIEGEEVRFMFQEYISTKLNEFIKEQIKLNKSLDEIKELLKDGIVIENDSYSMNDYRYIQNSRDSISKLQVYPLEIKNVLDSGKDVKKEIPVRPIDGISHELNSDDFVVLENGFEVSWNGTANTSRQNKLSTLDLSFDAPTIVKQSGIKNWEIMTEVIIDYYDVLNDGTLVLNQTYAQTIVNEENLSSTGIQNLKIDLPNDNIAIKYKVVQKYSNNLLNLEIEGKQTARLTSKLNSNLYTKSIENSKEFPKSILTNGIKGEESNPTSLIWNVTFNNNKLIRKENDGFNLYFDKDELNIYRYGGSGDKYSRLPISFSDLIFDKKITIDGKDASKDNRFTIVWNADNTIAQVRLNENIDKEVKFQIKYTFNIKESKVSGQPIIDQFNSSTRLKFEGMLNTKSFTNGFEIEPPTETNEDISKKTAINYLVLLDKRPLMIDYRTKEIIWGVAINTVTAERIGMQGLTYFDTFGEGMSFEAMDKENDLLMFKIDSSKEPKTSHAEYIKFIGEIKKILDDKSKYPNELAKLIIGEDGLLNQSINEDGKQYKDIVSFIPQENIAYISGQDSVLNEEKYVVSYPKNYPNYTEKLAGKVINGDEPGGAVVASPTKSEKYGLTDLRLDFIDSNKAIGTGSFYDNNAYYIMYKTSIKSDKPMEKVTNKGEISFANWIAGEGNTINWGGGGTESGQALEEVAKYNTIPKKEGKIKRIIDNASGRERLALNWNIRFNYDVDTRRVGDVPVVVVDSINKELKHEDYNLDDQDLLDKYSLYNNSLVAEEIDEVVLTKYTVDKDGVLSKVDGDDGKIIVTKKSGELEIVETDKIIEYTIKKDLDPSYVYEFELNQFIQSEDAQQENIENNVENVELTGIFKNVVSYTRGSQAGQVNLPDPGIAEKTVQQKNVNRLSKGGAYTSSSSVGSRQQINWTLALNEGYESMSDLEIKDTLISKHTFKYIKDPTGLENTENGKPELDNLLIREKINGQWRAISKEKYSLTNAEGATDKPLDNWKNGKSGFILKFNETMNNPIEIRYSTYGQVVDKKELPLKNEAEIIYKTETDKINKNRVIAEADFKINSESGGYEDESIDIGFTMRYDENQKNLPSDLDKGNIIKDNNVEESIIVLYRYQEGLVSNNHIYRVGSPDSNGYLEFKDVEQGNYIIKQYGVAEGYSVPDSLGYVVTGRNTNEDKSVAINQNQLASGNLVTIDTRDKARNIFGFIKPKGITKKDFAIYNETPRLKVDTIGALLNENGNANNESLESIKLMANKNLLKTEYTSNEDGNFVIGTINRGDQPTSFGTFDFTQPDQELNGYLKNTETLSHTLKQNKNGTVNATTISTKYYNYKTDVKLSVVDRETGSKINQSSYKLEVKNGSDWIPYKATTLGFEEPDKFTVTDGIIRLYNLDVGHYRLTQLSVGSGYLLNPEPVEFFAYGNAEENHTNEFEGKPPVMDIEFNNIRAKVKVINTLNEENISGSEFQILDSKDQIIDTFTITDEVEGYQTNLAPGTYTLKEISTTNNRPLNLNKVSFIINDTESVFENEIEKNTRTIEFENHLGSFEFETFTHNKNKFEIDSFTLARNNETINNKKKDLLSGDYSIKDIGIENDWILITRAHEFKIPDSYTDEKELHRVVDVFATQADLSLKNLDGDVSENTTKLLGANFELIEKNSNKVFKNDNDKFQNIVPGNYSLSQTKAPSKYGLNTESIDDIIIPKEVTVNDVDIDLNKKTVESYKPKDQTFYNYRGKVELQKISGETQKPLKDIEFDLYFEGVKQEGSYVTDDDGLIRIDLLSPGNYYFEEVKGDGSHIVTANKTPFSIGEQNAGAYNLRNVEISNHYANVIFKNTNPTNEIVYTDGQFTLFTKENNSWKEVDGFINFKVQEDSETFSVFGIKAGEYKLVQTKAPKGTIQNEFEFLFEVPNYTNQEIDGRVTLELDNYINYQGSLVANLIDGYGIFENEVNTILMDNSGNEFTVTQNKDKLNAIELAPGRYQIVTTEANGAIVVDDIIEIVIPKKAMNNDGIEISKTVRMTYAKQRIKLQDGRTKETLNTGVYTFEGVDYRVTKDGYIEIDKLSPGLYEYQQIKPANGYVLNSLNKGNVEVQAMLRDFSKENINTDDYPYVVLDNIVENNYTLNIIVSKTNKEKQPLEGVEFELGYDDVIKSDKTNDQGQIVFDKLGSGKYHLTETKTIEGYQIINDSIDIIIEDVYEGQPDDITISVTNEKIIKPIAPILPSTGISNQSIYIALGMIGLGGIIVVYAKKKKESK